MPTFKKKTKQIVTDPEKLKTLIYVMNQQIAEAHDRIAKEHQLISTLSMRIATIRSEGKYEVEYESNIK